jgi:hypothetical protein
MNEQIKELAVKAGMRTGQELTIFASGDGVGKSMFLEKFAELIVQECALTAALMEHGGRKNIGAAILDRFEIPINSNVLAGAEQMAGDGGYQIGTKEAYDEFVKKRNGEMKNERTN